MKNGLRILLGLALTSLLGCSNTNVTVSSASSLSSALSGGQGGPPAGVQLFVQDNLTQFNPNSCVPVALTIVDANGQGANMNGQNITVDTGTGSITFWNDSSCTSQPWNSSITFAGWTNETGFMKTSPSAAAVLTSNITVTSGGTLTVTIPSMSNVPSLTSATHVQFVDIPSLKSIPNGGSGNYNSMICTPMLLQAQDASGIPVPNPISSFSSANVQNGNGTYAGLFVDSNCMNALGAGLGATSGPSTGPMFFMIPAIQQTSITNNLTSLLLSIPSATTAFQTASPSTLTLNVGASTITPSQMAWVTPGHPSYQQTTLHTYGGCVPIELAFLDVQNNNYSRGDFNYLGSYYLNPPTFNVTAGSPTIASGIFPNSNCTGSFPTLTSVLASAQNIVAYVYVESNVTITISAGFATGQVNYEPWTASLIVAQ